ncbi:lytic transglycosylase domain-containing protein [Sphingobium sp. CR28]|uniref:lytic transglycosylase domain-containing protein n=1 Tax=Sphingobium sp. CR28 TaxID=3400272 RepID=UPI003FEEECC1
MHTMGKDLRKELHLGRWLTSAVLLAAATGSTGVGATQEIVQPLPDSAAASSSNSASGADASWQAAQQRIGSATTSDPRVDAAITEWRRLSQSDGYGFAAYSNFILSNPGWPSEDHFRDVAEKTVDPNRDSPASVAAFFGRFPPKTSVGKARYAIALTRLGQMDLARATARDAWRSGVVSATDEAAILGGFAGALTPDDHLARADALLWRQQATAAERTLPYVAPTRQAVVAARIAFQRKAPDAAIKMAAADPVGVMDAGYLADKSRWLRDNGNSLAARQLLASRSALSQYPADTEKWYEALLLQAKAAANDGQWTTAYAIASRVDDALPAGTDVSGLPIGVRDDYTSLVWLAGTAALNKLNRPADAEGMFTRYSQGGRNPSTITKGHYWAGRAAVAAGRTQAANDHFARAGAYADQYYGQLALERLGRPIPSPAAADQPIQLSAAERQGFTNDSLVRATKLLGERGAWADQTRFIRALAARAQTDRDHMFAAEYARTLGRPDLGVMVGRRALANGLSGYGSASFPRISVPSGHDANWTLVHAIARQESQFDRAIVSRAGARGLMQLMPATAAEVAGKIGVGYDQGSLFDPQYNIRLGSTYIRQLLNYYGGSYPLAIAAYNAGMGNVNKWLKANGDPRMAGGDIVQWIEDIPIWETKDYVQRVMENAVVYDTLNPAGSATNASAPLSRYLGKQRPG